MVDVHDDVDPGSKNCDRAVRLAKDPAKRQEGKEALRAVDKEVRNLQDEARRCELNLNSSHAGVWLWHCFGCVCVCVCVRAGALVVRCASCLEKHTLSRSLTHPLTHMARGSDDRRARDGRRLQEGDRPHPGGHQGELRAAAQDARPDARCTYVWARVRACMHACDDASGASRPASS